jgi:hypothetical protein
MLRSGVAVTEYTHPSFARMGHPVIARIARLRGSYFKASKLSGVIWQISAFFALRIPEMERRGCRA